MISESSWVLSDLVLQLKRAEMSVLWLISRRLADTDLDLDLLHLCKVDIWTALELAEQMLQRAETPVRRETDKID